MLRENVRKSYSISSVKVIIDYKIRFSVYVKENLYLYDIVVVYK